MTFFSFFFLGCYLNKKCPKFQKPKLHFFLCDDGYRMVKARIEDCTLALCILIQEEVISLSRYLSQEDRVICKCKPKHNT